MFDRPLRGREFFEEVIREHLDLGRPSRVQLLFDRKIIKTTPGKFAHPGHHRRRDPQPARPVQALPRQAVLQGGARPAHRDHRSMTPTTSGSSVVCSTSTPSDAWASAPTPACWSSSRWPTTADWRARPGRAGPAQHAPRTDQPAPGLQVRPTAGDRAAAGALPVRAVLPAGDHQPPAPTAGRPTAGRPGRPVHRPPDGLRPPSPGPERAAPTVDRAASATS